MYIFLPKHAEKSKNALTFSLTLLIRKQGRFPPATPWRYRAQAVFFFACFWQFSFLQESG